MSSKIKIYNNKKEEKIIYITQDDGDTDETSCAEIILESGNSISIKIDPEQSLRIKEGTDERFI